MLRHERGCTLNPQRVCGMCKMLADEGGPEPAPPLQILLDTLDTEGFKAMRELANDCPACILSALRVRNVRSEFGSFEVSGPDDGRNEWSYVLAKQEYWAAHNDSEAERNYPGY